MNIKDNKNKLIEVVRCNLYESSIECMDTIDEIITFLNNSNNYLEDLKVLVSGRNNENYYCFDKFINIILSKSSFEIRLLFLNNQDEFKDIIRIKDNYLCIWNTLTKSEKIAYLRDKKKFSDVDYYLINETIMDDINTLSVIIKDENIRNKIEYGMINTNIDSSIYRYLNLDNFDKCRILKKECYSTLLLNKCENFNDFKKIYDSCNEIFNLIDSNCLIFDNVYNSEIYSFILDNPNFIGRFNKKYLDLFSIVEINNMKNDKRIDSVSYSVIMQKLYSYDGDNASNYFNEESLRNYAKHSISVNPFCNLTEKERQVIFNDYSLFNKFIDTIMIEAMSEYFDESIILNMLRDDTFINDISSFAMELLLNKLSFKSSFNMLQRKSILDKVSHLNVSIDDKDVVFVKGYLDSPVLVNKSDHNMIFEMIGKLNSEDTLYYLTLPYINNVLGNREIIDLCINNDIQINNIINSKSIMEVISVNDLIVYINEKFKKYVDLSIFYNKDLCKILFNLSDKQVDEINFNEVNYLFESIRTKGMLSKQLKDITVNSYKSVLCAYLVFGLDETIKLVSDGNKDITLDEIKIIKSNVIDEKILLYKEENSSLFQNMIQNVLREIKQVGYFDNINDFEQEVRRNTYLDNLIYLMLNDNYDSYKNIILKLYNYLKYSSYSEYDSKKELYDYIKDFNKLLVSNKTKQYSLDFDKVILKNFVPKENVIYSERKRIGKNYLEDKKFKIFVSSLTDCDSNNYSIYYKDNYDCKNVKNDYIKFINKDIDFDSLLEHVLYPVINKRFDKCNCLSKMNINKPKDFDKYYNYLEDIKLIAKLNSKLDDYKYLFTQEEFLGVMNYICFGIDLKFKVKTKIKNVFNKLIDMCKLINGEIYIDKSSMIFIYKDNTDFYNIDEIIEYNGYIELLNEIIEKTYKFINRNIDDKKVMTLFASDYFNHVSVDNAVFPISNRYYEPKKRVFSIIDIEKMFSGYNLLKYKKISDSLHRFLFKKKNLLLYVDGYYDGVVDNMGLIISRWNSILSYAQKMDISEEELTLIKIENIITLMNNDNDIFTKSISKDIVKDICGNGYYEVFDLNKRIKMITSLYKKAYEKTKLSIPYVKIVKENYRVEVIDKYSEDMFRSFKDSVYKIGMIGNDFLHYSILSDNGFKVGIYYNNELISNCIGVRNGNGVYLNKLEGSKIDCIEELLKEFADELIEKTKEDVQNIEFVSIVNNELFNSSNGIRIDTTICDKVNYPINEDCKDFDNFINYDYLLNIENLYTDYADGITTILSCSCVVDKSNFKFYSPDIKYLRNRNKVLKLSNNANEQYINKIDNILLLCKYYDDSINIDNLSLSMMDTIFLGDDFVILITEKNNVIKYILNYDKRALNEVDLVLQSIN